MPLSLTDYRTKLIKKIIRSGSQGDVQRFIDTAMTSLGEHQLNGHIIARFVDKMIDELESFSPMNKDAQTWSNIKMGRICFHKIKREYEATVNSKI